MSESSIPTPMSMAGTEPTATLLQSVFDASPNGICVLTSIRNRQGDILDFAYQLVNRVAEQLSGHANLAGQLYSAVQPVCLPAKSMADFVEVIRTGQPLERQQRHTINGTDVWYATTICPLGDGVLLTTRDNTAEVQMLRDSEVRFQEIIDQSPVATLVLRGDDYIIEQLNAPMEALIGQGFGVVGQSLLAVMPELVNEPIWQEVRRVYEEGVPFDGMERPVTHTTAGVMRTQYYNLVYRPLSEKGRTVGMIQLVTDVTEQVQIRQRIEASEQLFRSLVEQAPMAVGLYSGHDLVIDISNDRMTRVMGKDPSIVGKPIAEAVPELVEQGFINLLRGVYDTGEPVFGNGVLTRLEKQGRIEDVYFDFAYTPLRDATGTITGVMSLATDVTEQVVTRQHLAASEARFRTLIEQAPVATCLFVGRELVIEVANDAMINLWGKGPSVMGQPLVRALPELDGQVFLSQLEQVYATGETYATQGAQTELVIDGVLKTFYFDYTYKPLFDESGAVYAIMDMAIDVTEEKKAQEEVLRFKYMADNAGDPFILMREDGSFAYLNQPALDGWGYTADEVAALRVPDVDPIYTSALFRAVFARAQREAVPTFETLHRRKDGNTYPVEINMSGLVLGGKPHLFAIARDMTERQKAAQALADSEARFRTLIEEAPVPTLLFVGPDLTLEVVNPAMLPLLGRGAEIIGKPYAEALSEAAEQGFMDRLLHVYATGQAAYDSEIQIKMPVHGTLETHYFDISHKPLRDTTGEVYAIMCMAVDVTGQVLARQKVEENLLELFTSFDQAPVGIALIGEEQLTFRMANEFYGQLTGRTPDQLIGKPLLDAIPELRGQGFDTLLEQVIATGVPVQAQEASVRLLRNGKWETIYVDFSYQLVNAGRKPNALVVAIDVTQQAYTRQKIEESARLFRTLLEAVPTITWTNTPDGDVDFYNQRWAEYTGLTFGQTDDANWQGVIHPDDLSMTAAVYQNALATGHPFLVENRFRRADGVYRWHLNQALPLRDETGRITKWVGTATDIEQQKQQEAELERQVQTRTAQLNTMIRELERSNQNLQQFAYVASHDLQEPLRKIQSFGDILKSQYGDRLDEGTQLLERMQSASARMSVLIRDLLTYSRISIQPETTQPVALSEVVRVVLTDLELVVAETGALIDAGPLPTVTGDRSQLNQLFQNLLSNALKFRKPAVSPVIRLTAQSVVEADLPPTVRPARTAAVYHRIDVSDNGIGFDEKYADRIFQVFQRLHGRSEYAGTGIGLAICEKVVANHGGAISAHSQPKAGATFSIYLPI